MRVYVFSTIFLVNIGHDERHERSLAHQYFYSLIHTLNGRQKSMSYFKTSKTFEILF